MTNALENLRVERLSVSADRGTRCQRIWELSGWQQHGIELDASWHRGGILQLEIWAPRMTGLAEAMAPGSAMLFEERMRGHKVAAAVATGPKAMEGLGAPADEELGEFLLALMKDLSFATPITTANGTPAEMEAMLAGVSILVGARFSVLTKVLDWSESRATVSSTHLVPLQLDVVQDIVRHYRPEGDTPSSSDALHLRKHFSLDFKPVDATAHEKLTAAAALEAFYAEHGGKTGRSPRMIRNRIDAVIGKGK